jgi:hypothetical protein
MEAVVAMAMLLRRFKFELAMDKVGMATGATIHTSDGLKCKISRREGVKSGAAAAPATANA